MIRTVEIRVAVFVAFHQAVKLAFTNAVGGIQFVRQQIRRGFRSSLGKTRCRKQGVKRRGLGVEIGQVGGGQRAGGGERGDVRIARVVNGGAIGQAILFGHVQQICVAEIHGVENVVLALRFRPLCHRAADHRGGAAHGLSREAFVLGDAGGGAGLLEFLGANVRNGGGEGGASAGKGGDGLPDGFEAVQHTEDSDEHFGVRLLFYIHIF